MSLDVTEVKGKNDTYMLDDDIQFKVYDRTDENIYPGRFTWFEYVCGDMSEYRDKFSDIVTYIF